MASSSGLVDEMTAVISSEHRSLYERHLEEAESKSIPEAERYILSADRVAGVVVQAPDRTPAPATLCRRGQCANATRHPAELGASRGARSPVSYSRSSAAVVRDE